MSTQVAETPTGGPANRVRRDSLLSCVCPESHRKCGTDGYSQLHTSAEQRQELNDLVTECVEGFLDELSSEPACYPEPTRHQINRLLSAPPEFPSDGAELRVGALLETVLAAARTGINTAAGSQLSFIPSGGIHTAALGRYLAAALNGWTGAASVQPGLVALEQSVLNWMLDLFGLGDQAAGVLLSGGSMANLTATITARSQMGDQFDDATVYCSERAHHSIAKGCRLAGIPVRNVSSIPVDASEQMNVRILADAMAGDVRAGKRPMMIVATAGTTDTGSIDPLHDCAELAQTHGTWLHVDAAYGGFFIMTHRGREWLDGIERADSITVDAHKSLMLPYGVGGLLVANGEYIKEAHQGRGDYLQDFTEEPELPDFCAMGPELSRPMRGLDVWLPLHVHGVSAFRNELDRMLNLAAITARQLSAVPGIELVVEPVLSIVSFAATSGNEASQEILRHLNASAEVHVSSTTIGGRFVVRLAFLNHRTTPAMAARAVALVRKAVMYPH